jgi:hypothetical protein
MKFDIALKDTPIGATVGRLERTDRYYACGICRRATGWRIDVGPDCPGSPICSDECLDTRDAMAQLPDEQFIEELLKLRATPPTA